MPDTQRPMAVTLQVVSIVLFTFIGYLNIGIPLAVLPGYVHSQLGYGAVIAGLVISVQYLATLLSRPYASRIIDNLGSKKAVQYGLAGCGLSGVLMLLPAVIQGWPMLSLLTTGVSASSGRSAAARFTLSRTSAAAASMSRFMSNSTTVTALP